MNMNVLEIILILFFGFLIISHLFNYFYYYLKANKIIEGLDNASQINNVKTPHTYDEYIGLQNTDPLFLAIKNASNIAFLKSQIDDISNLRQEINQLSDDVQVNNTQIQTIQQSLAGDLSPDEDNEDNEDNEEMIEEQSNLEVVNITDETIDEDI